MNAYELKIYIYKLKEKWQASNYELLQLMKACAICIEDNCDDMIDYEEEDSDTLSEDRILEILQTFISMRQ